METNTENVFQTVEKAQSAVLLWQGLGYSGRAKILKSWSKELIKNIDSLAEIIAEETGKPLSDAALEVNVAINQLKWVIANSQKVLRTQSRPSGLLFANIKSKVERIPFGVVGVIGPWNYPMHTPMGSISYALGAGNVVVFKPSEYTPKIGAALAELFSLVAPSPYIFQTLGGDPQNGIDLTNSRVDKIAFTGSTKTAKKVAEACAKNLIPGVFECGGKDSALIATDADLDLAADEVLWSAMANAGQSCIGIERVYVVDNIADKFIDEISQRARKLQAGKDYGRATMPPQINVIRSHIEDAANKGGRFVVGGLDSIKETIVEPIIMVDVPENSLEVSDETFGPTLVINRVPNIETAIVLANNSKYGLGNAVYSKRQGEKIARKLESGMVSINSVFIFAGIASIPFGGIKDSGYGRIHGPEGLLEFTYAKSYVKPIFKLPLALLSFKRTKFTDNLVKRLTKLLNL